METTIGGHMPSKIIVHKGRTNIVTVSLGIDVSADTITSEIRQEPDQESELIATWVVSKPGGGADGELVLKLDDTVTKDIAATSGYMDLKRITSGEPVAVFDKPLEVSFRGSVTA
jgi:hypothetical protein